MLLFNDWCFWKKVDLFHIFIWEHWMSRNCAWKQPLQGVDFNVSNIPHAVLISVHSQLPLVSYSPQQLTAEQQWGHLSCSPSCHQPPCLISGLNHQRESPLPLSFQTLLVRFFLIELMKTWALTSSFPGEIQTISVLQEHWRLWLRCPGEENDVRPELVDDETGGGNKGKETSPHLLWGTCQFCTRGVKGEGCQGTVMGLDQR